MICGLHPPLPSVPRHCVINRHQPRPLSRRLRGRAPVCVTCALLTTQTSHAMQVAAVVYRQQAGRAIRRVRHVSHRNACITAFTAAFLDRSLAAPSRKSATSMANMCYKVCTAIAALSRRRTARTSHTSSPSPSTTSVSHYQCPAHRTMCGTSLYRGMPQSLCAQTQSMSSATFILPQVYIMPQLIQLSLTLAQPSSRVLNDTSREPEVAQVPAIASDTSLLLNLDQFKSLQPDFSQTQLSPYLTVRVMPRCLATITFACRAVAARPFPSRTAQTPMASAFATPPSTTSCAGWLNSTPRHVPLMCRRPRSISRQRACRSCGAPRYHMLTTICRTGSCNALYILKLGVLELQSIITASIIT